MKKTLKLIFLASYIFVSTTNANTELEQTTPEPSQTKTTRKLPKLSAQQQYYLQNKWDFVENKLIEHPNDKKISMSLILKSLLYSGLTGTGFGTVGYLATDEGVAFGLIAYLTGMISLPFWVYYLRKEIDNDSIKSFIHKYHPDITKHFPNNNKVYTPEELYDMIDAIYAKFKKEGDTYLEKKGKKAIALIKKKVMEDIKSKKYLSNKVIINNQGSGLLDSLAGNTIGTYLGNKISNK